MANVPIWISYVTVSLSGVILLMIFWANFGRNWFRSYRMRQPFEAYFKLDAHSDAPIAQELVVLANAEVQIDIRLRPKLHYVQNEISIGFGSDKDKAPLVKAMSNPFVKEGKRRYLDPKTDDNHYIDYGDNYHIEKKVDRIKGNHYAMGFLVKTRGPGRFPLKISAITDDGDGALANDLTLIVKASRKRRSRTK